MENSAVFVMTNVVITPNQSRAECAESAGLWNCARDADCPPGGVNNLGEVAAELMEPCTLMYNMVTTETSGCCRSRRADWAL